MLISICPCCGRKFDVVKVVSYPLVADRDGEETSFSLAGVNAEGVACCSYHEFSFDTAEEADEVAASMDAEEMATYAGEMMDNARSLEDEHGYFFDYGPYDSDPYDCDY